MRIGLITEGETEIKCLPILSTKLVGRYDSLIILKPLKISFSPNTAAGVIARACKSKIAILRNKKVDTIILLLDHDDDKRCPGELAREIQDAVLRTSNISVKVLIKVKCFENWIIADPGAIERLPGRFNVTDTAKRQLVNAGADDTDAEEWLVKRAVDRRYNKIADGENICRHASVEEMSKHSRSFARFDKYLGFCHTRARNKSQRRASRSS